MSFDLKIRLRKGFVPPVPEVELPPLKRDRDRTEEEDRLWQKQRHERALEKAKREALAPFSKNLPMRNMAFVNEVLRRAGALFASTNKKVLRGPNGEVDSRKLGSNDGWLLSPEECAFVGERLKSWLDGGGEAFLFRDVKWDLTPTAEGKDDRANRTFLYDLATFFTSAAEHRGLEVG